MVTVKLSESWPYGPQDFPLVNRIVEPGDTITVTEDQARALLEQADKWEPADPAARELMPSETKPAELITRAPTAVLRRPKPREVIEPTSPDVEPARALSAEIVDGSETTDSTEGGEGA